MKISNKLWRRALLSVTAGLLISQASISHAARCEYVIQNEWGNGFVAAVKITNDTNTAINGWSVNWSYTDGSKKTSGWNANFSGNNPYAASGVGWNDRINPGQTIEFGVQGSKGVTNAPAAKPVVTGAICGSKSSSSKTSSSTPVRTSSSSSSRSSISGCNDHSSCAATTSSRLSSTSTSYSTSSFDCRHSSCNDFISSWSSSRSSSSSSSSSISSLYCPQGNTWPDCPFETRRSSSSSSRSSVPNISPVPDLKVTTHGLTVYVDTTGSVDADGDVLQRTIDFGDFTSISYPTAWHTYKEPGEYVIQLSVTDGKAGILYKTQLVSVSAVAGNQAPIARLTTSREYAGTIGAQGSSSFDLEGTPLTYEWDYGNGPFAGDASISISACGSSSSSSRSSSSSGSTSGRATKLITLTVSDGELKDTIQQFGGGGACTIVYDILPQAEFSYVVVGNTVSVDARASRDDIRFSWDFGDGTSGSGLLASHTYATPGTYDIKLWVLGPSLFSNSITKSVVVGASSSRSVSSSSTSYSTSSFDCRHSSCNDFISSWSSSRSSSSRSSSSYTSSLIYDYASSSSSSSGSSIPNASPVPDLKITTYGLTVHVDTTGSYDADGDTLTHNIGFGDDTYLTYKDAWHTYKEPGEYVVLFTLWDGKAERYVTKTQLVSVSAVAGNHAPTARLTGVREGLSIAVHASSSYDPENSYLSYEWDFGNGPFAGDIRTWVNDCAVNDTSIRTQLVTLTVSDGELKDTIQARLGGKCGTNETANPVAAFSYKVDGNKVTVDASQSKNEVTFNWDFGDGASGVGLIASHTYASSGSQLISLTILGAGNMLAIDSTNKAIVVGNISSSSSSSIFSSSSSRVSSSSSSVRSSSSQGSSDRNRYNAPRATTAPVIDGVVDSVWDRASWAPINVFWLGTQSNPSAQDYSGRYKALWDENYLYILYDITDDRIYDGVRDPLDRYWEDDTVELFIDENKSGGQHGYNTNAWAYHISTYGDVVDSTTGGAKLLNDHIDSRLVSNGNQHYWELRVRIYGDDYADWKSNTPLQLYAGKLMGFSACYIDNDGSSQRESMMGSVDTQGHKNNQGYLDASVFGSLLLVE